MAKTFWIHLALIAILILMVASKKGGKSKGGGWSSGTNRNPSNPGNTGSNWNPSHTGNTGGNWNPHPPNPGWNTGGGWGNNYNPAGSNYNKQMKPPKTKTNMKMVAAGAAAGALGGFVLGNAISNMRYNFDNDMDSRYYNSYRNQMPNQVYRPTYQDRANVPEERFVTDCYNSSMTEYVIKPNEGKNVSEIDQTEVRVKSTIIRQLCVTEYRRGPQYSQAYDSGINLLLSQSLTFFITLFVYFVVE
ncbi:major prion protein homolog [Hyla sarda]|uniref:major prion protein homolog n=1 Tax=Hyla sarda TaxID=327740 RepID=UPI0024C339D7|nr:major prion protein homolog [Hyla sarda]XP_056427364.1 major prion protein homolog [Hyla sarda]